MFKKRTSVGDSGGESHRLHVQSVDVSGFGDYGIHVTALTSYYDAVRITDAVLHANTTGGLFIDGLACTPTSARHANRALAATAQKL